jgi:transcriptional regulator with XRE-family HTH domain
MKEKLRALREAAKLTQKEAAAKLGVVQSAISMWETGESIPRTEILPKIASVYGCSISDFF